MLEDLSVSGFAIIEDIYVKFANGLNVITGESGAGKSFLIRALGVLCGNKARAEFVRNDWDQAKVMGTFVLPSNHPSLRILQEKGIATEVCEETVCMIVRRTISKKGRSYNWINDAPVTLVTLKDVMDGIVDILGQNGNMTLQDSSSHTRLLDEGLEDPDIFSQMEIQYKVLQEKLFAFHDHIYHIFHRDFDLEYLRFRLDLLETLKPSCEDFAELREQRARLTSLVRNDEIICRAQDLLEGVNFEESLQNRVQQLTIEMTRLGGVDSEVLIQALGEMSNTLEETSYFLSLNGGEGNGNNQIKLDKIENRLHEYSRLCEKFSVQDASQLSRCWQELKKDIEAAESSIPRALHLIKEIEVQVEVVLKISETISQKRREFALVAEREINSEIQQLAMKNSCIRMKFLDFRNEMLTKLEVDLPAEVMGKWNELTDRLTRCSPSGKDRIKYVLGLKADKEEKHRNLADGASGGELARIMLALKSVMRKGTHQKLLIFDEIDTGVSGRVADTVGKKIKSLSRDFQVICISHLPQVAVYGEKHFSVEKNEIGKEPKTSVNALEKHNKVEEIARLLSGAEVTKSSLKNAQSLVNRASLAIAT